MASPASSGRMTEPYSASIANPSPSSDSASRPASTTAGRLPPVGANEQAELVPSEPECLARRPRGFRQPGCEPHEQRVAARVAEGVVVPLESVQVVDREHRLAASARELVLERKQQPAAVAEPGQVVGQRLSAHALEQAGVVDEADPGADEHGHDRRDREDVGDDVVILEVLVCEHGERHEAADERGRHESALEPDGVAFARAARRRGRAGASHPARVRRGACPPGSRPLRSGT